MRADPLRSLLEELCVQKKILEGGQIKRQAHPVVGEAAPMMSYPGGGKRPVSTPQGSKFMRYLSRLHASPLDGQLERKLSSVLAAVDEVDGVTVAMMRAAVAAGQAEAVYDKAHRAMWEALVALESAVKQARAMAEGRR